MALSYIHVDYPEPHLKRARQILAAHPEVKKLFGNTPSSALYILGIVVAQTALSVALRDASAWWVILAAYTVGAAANHALFVFIHECTHNLVFKGSRANKLMGIFTNLPLVFPSAISFRKYHLIHHRHQGEMDMDADLSGPVEAKVVGNSALLKALWLLFFFLVEGIVRPLRLKKIQLWDRWTVLNHVILYACFAVLVHLAGWQPLVYLMLSSIFGIGLHPLGARWIQEHYIFKQGQETYSYYGPLNTIAFNVGYHNEHHDLMMVPWSRLPQLKAMAPEFYDTLHAHRSWTALLFTFLFDPSVSLYRRAVRPNRASSTASKEEPAVEAAAPVVTA